MIPTYATNCQDPACCPQGPDAVFTTFNTLDGEVVKTVDGQELIPLMMKYAEDRDYFSVGFVTESVLTQMKAAGLMA